MNSSLSSSRIGRSAVLAVAALLVMSACGGGSSDDNGSSADDDISTVTEPDEAQVEPLSTDVDTTDDVASTDVDDDPVATEPPRSETPIGTDASGTTVTQEYCDATRDVFAPGRSVRFLDGADSTGLEAAIRSIDERTEPVIDTAISSDANRIVLDLQGALDELIPIFESLGFDATVDPATLPDGGVRFDELGVVVADSGDFFEATLLDDCGYSEDQLDDIGFDFARSVATLPVIEPGAPAPTEPEPPVVTQPDPGESTPSGESTRIVDDTGRIDVFVPAEWNDVEGAPGPNEDRIVASTDRAAFLDSFVVPGMFIEAVDTPAGDGADVVPVAVTQITTSYEAAGCVMESVVDYQDVAYTGTETVFDCAPGFETRLIGGTNSSGTRIFVIAMVIEAGDTATRDLIADTFLIG